MKPQPQIDLPEAQSMLFARVQVRAIAAFYNVSTEAIYSHVRRGHLEIPRRPPKEPKPPRPSALIRFAAKCQRVESGCVEWTGAREKAGYGRFGFGGRGAAGYAHRWSYEHFVGPIPEGLTIDHLCRNKICVNPEHLEVVTQRENVLRGNAPAAYHARKTHCMRGHEFTEANTFFIRMKNGRDSRGCLTCRRARHRNRSTT